MEENAPLLSRDGTRREGGRVFAHYKPRHDLSALLQNEQDREGRDRAR